MAAGKALWVMLLVVAPLTGYSYAQAVALYAEASRAAVQFPELARGLSPLDGIVVPTLGAVYLGATFLFPFVAIRALGEEKTSGSVKLLLQLPYPTMVLVGAKLLAVMTAWLTLLLPAFIALAHWRSAGGHLAGGETANVVLGHGLYALVVGALALAAAAVTEGGATAAILTIGATLGFWVLDFAAAGGDGPLRKLSSLSLTALLRGFESGIFSLGAVAGALAAAAGLLALAAIGLRPSPSLRSRLVFSAVCVAGTGTAMGLGTGLRVYRDASEDRRNSFAATDEAALRRLVTPLRIEVRLAAEDPRYHDLRRRILSRLERVVPDVEITRLGPGRSALFGDGDDAYGRVEYAYGGGRVSSRSTSEREILPLLFQLAGVARATTTGVADYPGHPHVADSRSAELVLYAGAPLLIVGGWAGARWRQGRLPSVAQR